LRLQISHIVAKIKEIIHFLENIAPGPLQEDYDNAGLLTGNQQTELQNILISLDVTEAVIEEAINKNCNLIISHHPIIFKGIKKLTGSNYVERTVLKAIKNDLALYAIHTNLDNVNTGVNKKIGEKLGIKNRKTLVPKKDNLAKLITFVPAENTENVLNALAEAGAGNIGNYKKCSFKLQGKGTFQPTDDANPYIGSSNRVEEVDEDRIEVLFPVYLQNQVLAALRRAHPYEEVAYYLHRLENENQDTGSGMIGELEESMPADAFISNLKTVFNLPMVKHTALVKQKIKKVAWCGGAGSFLLKPAIKQEADVFISSDFKYHEYFDADNDIIIADVGHYESEQYTQELLKELLKDNFTDINIQNTEVNTNPIRYS
jgi:dinuclear metal center YbgI/SA1388 family protein